jgi:predicted nuclease of predicted toxin-antitoxin system
MKLLLDECTPKRLKIDFVQHQAQTVDDVGLKGLKNGELLQAAAGNFDVFLTVDRNIVFQQNFASLDLAIVILRARRNSYSELKALVPEALEAIKTIKPGDLVLVPTED